MPTHDVPPRHPPRTVYRLAAAADCDHRTARAWLAGRPIRTLATAARLEIAAERLGIQRPDPSEVRHGS